MTTIKHEEQIIMIRQHLEYCDNVCKLRKQLSDVEIERLLVNYTAEQIIDQLSKMENYKPLTSKYTNVYLTLKKWFEMDEKKGLIENRNNATQGLSPVQKIETNNPDKVNFLKENPVGSYWTSRTGKRYKVINENFLFNEEEETSLPINYLFRRK